jgi:hypothetical protein
MASTAPVDQQQSDQQAMVGCAVRAVYATDSEKLWPWIADPTRHPELAGSGEPHAITLTSGQREGVGTRFESKQRVAGGLVRYTSRSEVVGFEPNRRYHFRTSGNTDWDFQLEPMTGGTLVTHSFRFSAPDRWFYRLLTPILRVRNKRNARSMVRTLENLARLAGAPPPTNIQVSYDAA